MLYFYRGRYTAILRAVIGVALVVYGIIGGPASRISLAVGVFYVGWGLVSGINQLRDGVNGHNREGISGR